MKSCLFFAFFVVAHAQSNLETQNHLDLGSDGVWLPRHVADVGPPKGAPIVKQTDPSARCLPPGVPRIMLQARPFQIVEAPNRILLLFEGGAHVWRQIWMDGRAHPKDPNPDWLGDSIGHWEAGTLVVDSVGFNDKTWLDDFGHPHTERLHVVEKFTRTSPQSMKYEVVMDDPGANIQSWTAGSTFSFRAHGKLAEDICLDKLSR
jgi:hypothetical protein